MTHYPSKLHYTTFITKNVHRQLHSVFQRNISVEDYCIGANNTYIYLVTHNARVIDENEVALLSAIYSAYYTYVNILDSVTK